EQHSADAVGQPHPSSSRMRLSLRVLTSMALAVALSVGRAGAAQTPANRPNILFILTDDLDVESASHMPRLKALIADQGVTFSAAFATYPICCPSRASILTGQYPHNHQILFNVPPLGGFAKFRDRGGEAATVATWLQAAGYRTALYGKYLNGYPANTPQHVPPGWTVWHGTFDNENYFNYRVNENGVVRQYADGPADYETDVHAASIVRFLEEAESRDAEPWFIYFAPYAPHGDPRLGLGQEGPALPAPRHRAAFATAQAPRTASFNEDDVSDKPPAIRLRARLTPGQIALLDHLYRERLRSLLAVDEAIERFVQTLTRLGELANTYIVFTSDNGYHLGQHRFMTGKFNIYEEDIRVPTFVRGPGVPAKARRDHFALNIDWASTFAELAGAAIPPGVDGRSLVPLLRRDAPGIDAWRQDFLVEIYRPAGEEVRALRTRSHMYAESSTGAVELYDLRTDPAQLRNLFAPRDSTAVAPFSARLKARAACAGASCRP
ncbi:MAG: sulfatase family protein, partial [Gemmatimonadaceae bacterium]